MRVILSAAALVAGFAVSAQAATVHETIVLSGGGGVGTSYDYSSGAVDVTVTAYQHSAGVLGSQISVGQWGTGLGAQFSGDSQHLLEGNGPDEMLIFSFNREVTLEKVWVSYYDRNDDLELASYLPGLTLNQYNSDVDLDDWFTTDGSYNGDNDDWGQTSLAAAEKVTGSILGIGSDYYADEFKIYKIKVSYDDTPPPPQPGGVIPLPAAGWLMLGAIGGLGILGRRKRRS